MGLPAPLSILDARLVMGFQRRSLRAVAGLAVAAVVFSAGTAQSSAGPVEAKKAQAAQLAAQIDAMAQRIAVVDARLNDAKAKLAATDAALARASAMLGAANQRFANVKGRMANQAVDAYVHGGSLAVVQQLAGRRRLPVPRLHMARDGLLGHRERRPTRRAGRGRGEAAAAGGLEPVDDGQAVRPLTAYADSFSGRTSDSSKRAGRTTWSDRRLTS